MLRILNAAADAENIFYSGDSMKRIWPFIIALFALAALCGCANEQYASFEEAVRAGKTLEDGIRIDGIDVSNMELTRARRLINENNQLRAKSIRYDIKLSGKAETVYASELGVIFNTDDVLLQAANLPKRSIFASAERELATTPSAKLSSIEKGIWDAANRLKKAPVEAEVKLAPDGSLAISADEMGYEVDTKTLASRIAELVPACASASIDAPTKLISAQYTVEQAKNDTQLIAEFTTEFKGSVYGKPNRVFNIVKAAGLVNNGVVEPGDIYSINAALGPRNEENGWKVAAGIKDGAYVQEYGGGVCQVSTTLYNALLMADMHIVERHHHSWPLGYVDIGRDATISTGGPDLRFENTSGARLFIIAEADSQQKKVTVRLYGRPLKDGVTIGISSCKLKTLDNLGTEVMEDPSLSPGEQKVVRKSRQGSVAATYKTYYSADGEVLGKEEITRDTYHSIKGLVMISPSANATLAQDGMPDDAKENNAE